MGLTGEHKSLSTCYEDKFLLRFFFPARIHIPSNGNSPVPIGNTSTNGGISIEFPASYVRLPECILNKAGPARLLEWGW